MEVITLSYKVSFIIAAFGAVFCFVFPGKSEPSLVDSFQMFKIANCAKNTT